MRGFQVRVTVLTYFPAHISYISMLEAFADRDIFGQSRSGGGPSK